MILARDIEQTDDPSIIAIDPGGTTGWCVITVHRDALCDPDVSILKNVLYWEQGQFEGGEIDQESQLCELMDLWDGAALLIEDFTLRFFSMDPVLLSPVRITSVLEFHATVNYEPPRRVFKQQPELAMSTITDERLKRWDIYRKGEPHARDAVRHAITFLRRAKDKETIRQLAWPELYAPAPHVVRGLAV